MTFENAPVGKLSLELNDGIKPTFVVLDDENYCFGEGYEIPEAITVTHIRMMKSINQKSDIIQGLLMIYSVKLVM